MKTSILVLKYIFPSLKLLKGVELIEKQDIITMISGFL